MHVCMDACMYACMYVCVYACVYACMHVCMHVCMDVCICMNVCMYVCSRPKVYVFMYVCSSPDSCHHREACCPRRGRIRWALLVPYRGWDASVFVKFVSFILLCMCRLWGCSDTSSEPCMAQRVRRVSPCDCRGDGGHRGHDDRRWDRTTAPLIDLPVSLSTFLVLEISALFYNIQTLMH